MSFPQPLDRTAPPVDRAVDATHELKSLLGVLMGVCESLGEGLHPQGEAAELARLGVLAAERAAGLVQRLETERLARPARYLVPQAESQAPTVLVVDDDPDLLKLMTAAFARAGFKAYAAANGRQGLQLAGALQPDLMVTDIVMPEKEGIALIVEARTAAPRTAVIAISGGGAYGRSGNFLQWAEELGAEEVMAKPFLMSQLVTAARVVLDRRGAPNGVRGVTG